MVKCTKGAFVKVFADGWSNMDAWLPNRNDSIDGVDSIDMTAKMTAKYLP